MLPGVPICVGHHDYQEMWARADKILIGTPFVPINNPDLNMENTP